MRAVANTTRQPQEVASLNGRQVKERREAAGMSQRQLSVRSGLTERTIGALERGEQTDPQLSTLEALAAALGVTVADLIATTTPAAAGTTRTAP